VSAWVIAKIIGQANFREASSSASPARALVNQPALILADEPTGALDSNTGDEILSLFEELHHQGATIIMVTHDADVAYRAERCVTLHDGRVVTDSPRKQPVILRAVREA